MAGHARERRPGVWELRAYAGRDPLTGAKKTETETVYGKFTKREAQRLADAFAVRVRAEPVSADMTFGELLNKWYELVSPRLVPAGAREYRWMIDVRLRPLHHVKLDRLGDRTGTALLDEFYVALRDRGGLCRRREKCDAYPCDHGGGGPLAGATVVRTHVVIHAALEQAMKWGAISRNPAAFATPGEVDAEEIDPPEPADVARLFKLAESEDPELVVLLVLASTTGARRGRVLALKWEDVDLERGVVRFGHVLSRGAGGPVRVAAGRGSKNRKGKRNDVPLDPAVVAVLLAQWARCAARCELAGATLSPDAYVFAADGIGAVPWNPDSTSRRFARIRDEVGLDDTRLHDLRHFVVSYLLASGVDLAVVKELVGHAAGSATTLTTYAHAASENKRAATGILARLLELDAAPVPPDAPDPDDEPMGKVIPFRSRRAGDAEAG